MGYCALNFNRIRGRIGFIMKFRGLYSLGLVVWLVLLGQPCAMALPGEVPGEQPESHCPACPETSAHGDEMGGEMGCESLSVPAACQHFAHKLANFSFSSDAFDGPAQSTVLARAPPWRLLVDEFPLRIESPDPPTTFAAGLPANLRQRVFLI